jgi:uncharacterized protein YlaI
MANRVIDYTGQKLGQLTFISRFIDENKISYWFLSCDCGGENQIVKIDAKKISNMVRNKDKHKLMCDDCKLKGLKYPKISKLKTVLESRRKDK